MYSVFKNLRTVARTQTNVRLLMADPKARETSFTRIINVILDGTMEVFTGEPFKTQEAGDIHYLPWWVGEMPSSGKSRIGEIKMTGNPALTTTGVIKQFVHGFAFPGILEAAVFQKLYLPEYGELHNKYPVMISAEVDEVPPFGILAKCAKGAILFDENNVAKGMIGGRSLTILGPA